MSFAIIRGGIGRRDEVDFGDDPARLDVSVGEATVRITVEATADPGPPNGRRFATLEVPREELIAALGAAFGRAGRYDSAAIAPGAHRAAPRQVSRGHSDPFRDEPARPGKGRGQKKLSPGRVPGAEAGPGLTGLMYTPPP